MPDTLNLALEDTPLYRAAFARSPEDLHRPFGPVPASAGPLRLLVLTEPLGVRDALRGAARLSLVFGAVLTSRTTRTYLRPAWRKQHGGAEGLHLDARSPLDVRAPSLLRVKAEPASQLLVFYAPLPETYRHPLPGVAYVRDWTRDHAFWRGLWAVLNRTDATPADVEQYLRQEDDK